MTHSDQINELAAALAKAQGAMKPALKDATNPHYKSKYADLAANVEAARPHLAANGIAVVQEPTTCERGIAVVTMLLHASGQWMKFDPLTVPMGKIDAHGVGSATTYARRYALGAALGLVAEDDDGNAAVGATNQSFAVAPPKMVKPAKYDDLLTDLLVVAKEDASAARQAFAQWPQDCRDYLINADQTNYAALKALTQGRAGKAA